MVIPSKVFLLRGFKAECGSKSMWQISILRLILYSEYFDGKRKNG